MNVDYFAECACNFKRNLLDLCFIKNITLKKLAEGTNISYRTLNNYTRNNFSLPNVVVALKIAEFFGVSVECLFIKKIEYDESGKIIWKGKEK